jgi:excisionase family DNA binding protein
VNKTEERYTKLNVSAVQLGREEHLTIALRTKENEEVPTMETVYYTPKEVAERLKLRVQTVYDYIRKGRLPVVRLGNRCRIAESDLDAFLAQQKSTSRLPAEISEQTGAKVSGAEWRPDNRYTNLGTPKGDPRAEGGMERDVLEQIKRNDAARRLLAEWLADESGYDDRVWPIVEKLIEENPVSLGEPNDG